MTEPSPPTYRIFGLRVRSEIPLGDLPEAESSSAADVEIRRARLDHPEQPSASHVVSEDGTLITIPRVGRYLVRKGREILVEASEGASERNQRLYLLGSAFGALLHQRGLLPLHANAIDLDGRAVAFCGHSGAGKSTLAAWFHDRGHRILADDVCVIGFDESDRPLAFPGIPRLRLWREAIEASGRAASDYAPSFDGETDKYDVPTRPEEAAEPIPLDRVYLLAQALEGAEGIRIDRLSGVAAVDALVSNTYRGAYLRSIGRTGDHLMQCLKVARTVPVFRAERPWRLEAFDEQAEALERHSRLPPD
jgi:hypothetical protein